MSAGIAARTVVFDFGGVLFRWEPAALLRGVLPHLASSHDEALRLSQQIFESFRPGSDWSEFDRGRVSEETLAARIAQRTGLAARDVAAVVEAVPGHLEPQAPTVQLLHRLHGAGLRLCYLSNMPAPYAAHLEATHAFMRLFDDGVFSARVGHVKPEPRIFEAAERALRLDPAQTVFIDDVQHNADQAREHGWSAIHFIGAQDCERQLRTLGWL